MALARMRSRFTRATIVRRVKTGLENGGAEFGRFLHDVIGRCLFDRREAEPEVGLAVLLAQLAITFERAGSLGYRHDTRGPFAVAAVEQADVVAGFGAHDVEQIMRLLFVRHSTRARRHPAAASTKRRSLLPPGYVRSFSLIAEYL